MSGQDLEGWLEEADDRNDRDVRLEVKRMIRVLDAVIRALPVLGQRMQLEAERTLETEHASEYLRGYALGYYAGLVRAKAVLGHIDNWIRMSAEDGDEN